jgi:transposase
LQARPKSSANIKLASVATDFFDVSGRLMLRALIEGKANPEEWPCWPRGSCTNKIPELELTLEGHIEEHHPLLLEL